MALEQSSPEDPGDVILQKYLEEGTLEQKHVNAIKFLSQGYNQKETAQELRFDESTISKWTQRGDFRRARAEYENELRGEELRSFNNEAIATALRNLATAAQFDDPENAEVEASKELLKATGLYGETYDIENERRGNVVCQNDAEEMLVQKFREFSSSPVVIEGFTEFLKQISSDKMQEVSRQLASGDRQVIDIEVN